MNETTGQSIQSQVNSVFCFCAFRGSVVLYVVTKTGLQSHSPTSGLLMGQLLENSRCTERRSGFSPHQLSTSTVRGTALGGATSQDSNEINSCSLYGYSGKAGAMGSYSSFTSPKRSESVNGIRHEWLIPAEG